ncbi:4-hydroxy-tetrahydrodipicolinate reductase [Legionella spiritensis]|uniref:4-hydroxy-tetrahydrodipicolinate reductase n=1 Tax=Legionella spiritensis TaxID=452 RepID=A0A0W0YZB0_LEGSP|nr:4-hydroxy-tetrahydrodipicolinate reductase [Legionella spiritensis]KTD62225.1 dihydrodipicolinate reductase [Legionella spiritensis]SNV29109.1 dihydrodipicolinate reductase [Legionella spiritensis]
MTIRVIVNGARGKMGLLACDTIEQHPDFQLVGALSRQDNLRKTINDTHARIVIDLTRADCVFENTLAIIECGAHPVIGTSGLLDAQINSLTELAKARKLGGIIVPNFSISAILMMRFAAQAARYLSDVEIIETHHQQKFDAPSGTALKTAELIAHTRTKQTVRSEFHELLPGARGGDHHGIRIHSLRLPGVLARQDVLFGNSGETLTITHNTLDRASFMPGLLLCCQKVMRLDGLYYGLEHLLEE